LLLRIAACHGADGGAEARERVAEGNGADPARSTLLMEHKTVDGKELEEFPVE
jgi:hypothetical protein